MSFPASRISYCSTRRAFSSAEGSSRIARFAIVSTRSFTTSGSHHADESSSPSSSSSAAPTTPTTSAPAPGERKGFLGRFRDRLNSAQSGIEGNRKQARGGIELDLKMQRELRGMLARTGQASAYDTMVARATQRRKEIALSRYGDLLYPGQEQGDFSDRDLARLKNRRKLKTQRLRAPREHKFSTSLFRISHRKLNDLGRQISGKPIDQAILQMQFSEKKASKRIMSMLAVARDHATDFKELDRSKLVVSQAWVAQGPAIKKLDIKGRGRTGRIRRKYSKLSVILKEGLTREEKTQSERKAKVDKIRAPSYLPETTPIRNPGPGWAW